ARHRNGRLCVLPADGFPMASRRPFWEASACGSAHRSRASREARKMALFTARKLPAPGWSSARSRAFRNMLAEMAGEQPPEGVIAAARRVADDEIDGLAGVELFRRLRRSLDTQA